MEMVYVNTIRVMIMGKSLPMVTHGTERIHVKLVTVTEALLVVRVRNVHATILMLISIVVLNVIHGECVFIRKIHPKHLPMDKLGSINVKCVNVW